MVQSSWKTVWWFLTKTQVSPYDPTTAHFGIHAKDLKTYTHTKTYTRMFTAASFTVAET